MQLVRRWRADLAKPPMPPSRDERIFLTCSAVAIVVVSQLFDGGSARDLLVLVPAVLAFALGVLMPSSRAANALGNLLFVPMFLLGGGGPPRDVMTGPMRTISDAMPLSHLVGGLRVSWLGTTDDPHVLLWPVLVAVTATALAVRVGRRRLGSL